SRPQLATATGDATPVVLPQQAARRRSLGATLARTYAQGTRVRDKLFSLSVARAFAEFGSHSVIQLPTRLVNEHRIAVGSGGLIGADPGLPGLSPRGGRRALT